MTSASMYRIGLLAVYLSLSALTLSSSAQYARQKSANQTINLGNVECVYWERVNGEKDWTLISGMGDCNLFVTKDRIVLNGGSRRKGQSSYGSFTKLLTLEKKNLVPIDLNRLPNSINKRDWERAPLNELESAFDFGQGVQVEFIWGDEIYVRKTPWGTSVRDVELADRGLYRVGENELELVIEFTKPWANQFPTGEFVQHLSNGPVHIIESLPSDLSSAGPKNRVYVSEVYFKDGKPKLEPPNHWSYLKKNPSEFRFVNDHLYVIKIEKPENPRAVNKPPLLRDKIEIFLLNEDSLPETKIAEYLSPTEMPQAIFDGIHGAYYTDRPESHYLTYGKKIQQPMKASSRAIIEEIDTFTGKTKRRITPPKNVAFMGLPNFQSDHSIFSWGMSFPPVDRDETSKPGSLVILKVPPGSSRAEIFCEIPDAIFNPAVGNHNMVTDDTYLYFTAQLPEPLITHRLGYRSGNYGIFRYPLNATK